MPAHQRMKHMETLFTAADEGEAESEMIVVKNKVAKAWKSTGQLLNFVATEDILKAKFMWTMKVGIPFIL